jgi:hypothetical protein
VLWCLLVTIVLQLVLAMVALLCTAVVVVTTWHLPRSLTAAMVLGLLFGAVALGCIVVLLSMWKWQSGTWRWCMVVAVVVCGVGQLCGVALFGIDVTDEEAPRERSMGIAGDSGGGVRGGLCVWWRSCTASCASDSDMM